MEQIQKSAKTIEEAISEALKELKTTREETEITVLDAGAKGILGFGARPAKILAVKKFNPENKAKTFIREIAAAMGVSVEVSTVLREKQMDVTISGSDMGVFIGKRGQTLDSLQYLVSLIVNKGDAPYVSINLDAENYRQRRKETLETLALNLAKKVKQTKKNVVLEPMSPNERRIIHAALQNDRFVSTYSEGEEPYRNVVIAIKRQGFYKSGEGGKQKPAVNE